MLAPIRVNQEPVREVIPVGWCGLLISLGLKMLKESQIKRVRSLEMGTVVYGGHVKR